MSKAPVLFSSVCLAFLFALAWPLAGVEPRLRLTADKTTARVGETITVECAVLDAPPFACWGATVLVPASGLTTTGQEVGSMATYVRDSRGRLSPGARFGGYSFEDHLGGTHVLGKVTLKASTPGTYLLSAPPFSQVQPFGGILLPAKSAQRVIPLGAELTITITGGGGDVTPPGLSLQRLILHGTASANTVSVKVEGIEVWDPRAGRWSASVEVPPLGKLVEVTARTADGASCVRQVVLKP